MMVSNEDSLIPCRIIDAKKDNDSYEDKLQKMNPAISPYEWKKTKKRTKLAENRKALYLVLRCNKNWRIIDIEQNLLLT